MINKINSKNLIIGTANFSSNYGLKHKNKAINNKKKKNIISFIKKKKLIFLIRLKNIQTAKVFWADKIFVI